MIAIPILLTAGCCLAAFRQRPGVVSALIVVLAVAAIPLIWIIYAALVRTPAAAG